MREWVRSLGETRRPYYGQVSLWVLLGTCLYLSFYTHLQYQSLPKGTTVSLLGYLLPSGVFDEAWPFYLSKVVLWLSAACWAFRALVPWSGWICVLAYTLMVSIYWENLPWFKHKFVIPNAMLVIYALWYQLRRREMASASAKGIFWRSDLFPRWVYFLSVYSIGIHYCCAGLSKLQAAGLEWGNGLSLQIWAFLGPSESFLTQIIVSDRFLARSLQMGVHGMELLAIVAIFQRHVRVAICVGMVGFHIGVYMCLGIPFFSNVVLLLLVFLPWYEHQERLAARWQAFRGRASKVRDTRSVEIV